MSWLAQNNDPTFAELLARSQISGGGGGINAALSRRAYDPYVEAAKQIAPAIASYVQKKKSDEIANQYLQQVNSPFAGGGSDAVKYQQLYQQSLDNQPDTATDDLNYEKEYRQVHPELYPQNADGNQKVAITLPDGSTAYVTGNAALDYYTSGAGRGVVSKQSEVPGVPKNVYANSSKTTPYNPAKDLPYIKMRSDTADATSSAPVAGELPTPDTTGGKQLDADTARAILNEAGGDKQKARAIAISRGYQL